MERPPLLRGLRALALADFVPDPELPDDLRAALLRLDPAEDLARDPLAFLAAPPLLLRLAVERDAVDFEAEDLRAPLDFFARLPLLLPADPELLAELALALPSIVHLPDITRCAASATASAIKLPSLVALAIMLLAAWEAVSAASRPASRMARRAFGLALIAAAAAASPAASISLLIAPLASLSTVLSLELEEEPEVFEDVFRADFAIVRLPPSTAKDT